MLNKTNLDYLERYYILKKLNFWLCLHTHIISFFSKYV